MYRTRTLLQSVNYGSVMGPPKLLLPAPSFVETFLAAMQGAWAQVVDQESRDTYEAATKKNVIKDTVLQNAQNGNMLTFALFHNIYQCPLWKESKFDIQEFVEGVGPALENFHDVLGRLRNQIAETEEEDKKQLKDNLKKSDEDLAVSKGNPTDLNETLFGMNRWKKEADEDPESLASQLAKMTTPVCFDAFYYTSKLEVFARPFKASEYQTRSCEVSNVALLNARAMVMDQEEVASQENVEHSEFQASEQPDPPVAAQMDVLYEVTHTYKQTIEEPVETSEGEDDNTVTSKERTETVAYTNLVVAVFEGWLHGGPDKELKWRVAMLRDAFEFPYAPPTVKKV